MWFQFVSIKPFFYDAKVLGGQFRLLFIIQCTLAYVYSMVRIGGKTKSKALIKSTNKNNKVQQRRLTVYINTMIPWGILCTKRTRDPHSYLDIYLHGFSSMNGKFTSCDFVNLFALFCIVLRLDKVILQTRKRKIDCHCRFSPKQNDSFYLPPVGQHWERD